MVPNGWEVRELNEICSKTISYGIVQTGPEVANGIPCIRVVDLSKKHMNTSDMIKTSEKIHQSYKKTILEKDELVMALRGEIGLVRIIEDDLSGINITRGIARLAPKKNWVVPDFLLWAMRSYEVKKDLSRKSGGSALQEISLTALRKVKITLPPLPEQQKIAKILATWDKAIDTTERLIDNSKQQKKALMQQLLTGKKRLLDDNGKPFEGDWKRVELGTLLDYEQPAKYLVKSTEYSDEYSTPVLTAGKTFILGYTNEDFGIFEENLPTIIFDDFTTASKFVDFPFKAKSSAMKMLIAKESVSIKFVYEAMQVMNFPVGGHKRHWISTFSNLTIPLPSLEEQQKIAAVLTNADNEIELLEQQLADLQQEKKALMQVLLTGKVRVGV